MPQQDFQQTPSQKSRQPDWLAATNPVRDRVFVFTGKLASMSRARARRYVEDSGGQVRKAVSRATHYLVVGEEGWSNTGGDVSRKLEKARLIKASHGTLEILGEHAWLELLGLESKRPHENRLFNARTCCQLLKIPRQRFQLWRRMGLLVPAQILHEEELFTFQELKALRNLDQLLKQGVSLARIQSFLKSLENILEGVEQPLILLGRLGESHRLLLRTEGHALDAGGQLLLDFEGNRAETLASKIVTLPENLDPWELYWEAERCLATKESQEQGREFLERALAQNPAFADVYCLQGSLLLHEGRLQEAQKALERALELEPAYGEAWYTLGLLMDRQSNWLKAVSAHQEALRADPDFEMAHFHLALLYEDAQDSHLCEQHWNRYLELATDPDWIRVASEHLSRQRPSGQHREAENGSSGCS